MTSSLLPLAAGLVLAPALLASCGDPLVTAQDRGDAVLGLRGRARASATTPPAGEQQVAVLFLRASLDRNQRTDWLETEVIPGTIEGELPADFRVELQPPEDTYPYDVDIHYRNLDGTWNEGVFSAPRAPDGVRIGHLVIGPAAELVALPAEISFSNLQVQTLGEVLAPHLPTTTISSYQVIYAEGVDKGTVIYPTRTDGKLGGGLPISAGFTLVDARTYFEATIWQECAGAITRKYERTPEQAACEAANQGRIQCATRCNGSLPDLLACRKECAAAFPGQLDRNGCLLQVAGAEVSATCGAERVPRPEELKLLSEEDSLSVVLGDDDVKAGLWMLHAMMQPLP